MAIRLLRPGSISGRHLWLHLREWQSSAAHSVGRAGISYHWVHRTGSVQSSSHLRLTLKQSAKELRQHTSQHTTGSASRKASPPANPQTPTADGKSAEEMEETGEDKLGHRRVGGLGPGGGRFSGGTESLPRLLPNPGPCRPAPSI